MGQLINVRLGTPEDAEAITRLALEVQDWHVAGRPDLFKPGGYDSAPEIATRIASDDQFYWVALLDDVTVGYAYARVMDEPENRWKYASRIVIVDQMAVAERFRRQGAATRLWTAIREFAEAKRVHRIVLNVWAFNTSAQRFYESVGLTPFYERLAVELDSRDPGESR